MNPVRTCHRPGSCKQSDFELGSTTNTFTCVPGFTCTHLGLTAVLLSLVSGVQAACAAPCAAGAGAPVGQDSKQQLHGMQGKGSQLASLQLSTPELQLSSCECVWGLGNSSGLLCLVLCVILSECGNFYPFSILLTLQQILFLVRHSFEIYSCICLGNKIGKQRRSG